MIEFHCLVLRTFPNSKGLICAIRDYLKYMILTEPNEICQPSLTICRPVDQHAAQLSSLSTMLRRVFLLSLQLIACRVAPCHDFMLTHVDVIWVSKWFQRHTIWCGKLMSIGDLRMSQNRSACLNDFKICQIRLFFFKPLNLRPWSRRNLKSALLWCPNSEPCWFTVHPHFGCSMRLNEAQCSPHFYTIYIYIFITSPYCLADYGMLVSQGPPFDWLKPAINNLKSTLKLPPNAWNPLALSHDVPFNITFNII